MLEVRAPFVNEAEPVPPTPILEPNHENQRRICESDDL